MDELPKDYFIKEEWMCHLWPDECDKEATHAMYWSDRGPLPICEPHSVVFEQSDTYTKDHSYDQTGSWRENLPREAKLAKRLYELGVNANDR